MKNKRNIYKVEVVIEESKTDIKIKIYKERKKERKNIIGQRRNVKI